MRYGMPSYLRHDVVEVSFASQKRYISLYILRQAALQANATRLGGLSVGKGCIRFRRPTQIYREALGKGPTIARTSYHEDLVTVVLEDICSFNAVDHPTPGCNQRGRTRSPPVASR